MAKRRGDGEGSIYQATDGRWRAEVSLGYKPDGKPRRKVVYGKTRAEVAIELRKLLDAKDNGQNLKPERLTVGAFLQAWLDVKRLKRRSQTCRSYEWIIRQHLTPGLGRIVLAKLSAQQVQNFLVERHGTGLSAGTIKHIHATLRSALTHARKMKAIRENVAKDVELPTGERYRAKVLTPDQAREFLKVAVVSKLGPLFIVALSTGLRKGELLGLRWQDIDFPETTLRVSNALERRKGEGLLLCPPKSERSQRAIQMPAITVQALQEQRARQAMARDWAGASWEEGDFVFTTSKGTPLPPENVNPELKTVLKAAKLPNIRTHDLRHSAAVLLLSQGVHLKLISELLGHSTITLTSNTYLQSLPAMRNEVASRMDRIFSDPCSTPTSAPTKPSPERVQ